MPLDLTQLPERFNQLGVSTPEGRSGVLNHVGHYGFIYDAGSSQVSLTMPNRPDSYNRGSLHPVFEMNLPEGFTRRYIAERLQRYTRINDMLFLALQQNHGVGRLSYQSDLASTTESPSDLEEILHWDGKEDIFKALLEKYLLNGNVSGVQPKVLVNSGKSSLIQPDLIVKSGGDEYPQLALNEFICMSIAKAAGIPVPEFWLSDNQQLFIMRRFDIDNSQQLGMEDFAVLMGLSSQNKYRGSYEAAAKVLDHYGCTSEDRQRLFDQIALSCLLGNGDAHLKNFALLYSTPDSPPRLSPAYDIVCTRYYPELGDRLALKLNDSHHFPDQKGLLTFAKSLHVKGARARIEALAQVVLSTLEHLGVDNAVPLKSKLIECVDRVMAQSTSAKYTGRTHEKAIKKPRKTDKL